MGGVMHGPRLRDKADPSHYDLCGCGLAKKKDAARCLGCFRVEQSADRRAETLCACGARKQARSETCRSCAQRRRAGLRWGVTA